MEPDKPRPWHKLKKINLKLVDKKSKKVEIATAKHAHRFLVSRMQNLRYIRRHLIAWLTLLIILISLNALQVIFNQNYVTTQQPAEGGAYAEGVLGPFNNLNPLFATSDAEVSASKLIFSSLLSYDTTGHLQGDLAQSYSAVDNGRKYVVDLKPGLTWHDGKPITAEDVVFTVKTMQNPKTGASQFSNWQSIEVLATGKNQVTFTLPASYAPFASALTFPILPQHILGKVAPENLQENSFNKNPIGSGPFKYVNLQKVDVSKDESAVQLVRFDNYWAGQPKLAKFSLYVYNNQDDLAKGIMRREINGASGVRVSSEGLKNLQLPLNNGVYALFRTDSQILKDKTVRNALEQATDRQTLRKKIGQTQPLEGPMINNQTPLANKIVQPKFDLAAANKLLDSAGWVKNKNGIRQKDQQLLELRLVAVDDDNYKKVTSILAEQWQKLGIKVEKQLIDPEQVQQIILRPRAYDVLVYELSMGGDPDGYAFWHSSQISGSGLNFANYVSPAADDALTTARGRLDSKLRDTKYVSFASHWVKDTPAVALYRSTLQYTTTSGTLSLSGSESLVNPTDRFYNVVDWSAESTAAYKTP